MFPPKAMKLVLTTALILLTLTALTFLWQKLSKRQPGGAPPYQIEDLQPPTDPESWWQDWQRPAGPARVGLQVGHWKNAELPEELARLRGNTGASGGGKAEWQVNLTIAELTRGLLEKEGVSVDIIPSTVPERYWADVFVAIHADGSTSPQTSGFKAATPRRDFSGKASALLQAIEESYQVTTGLTKDPNVSRNMSGYYAFSWWRYTHAVHPMTAAIILETGFLSSPADRRILIGTPEKAAQGLAQGILHYLRQEQLL